MAEDTTDRKTAKPGSISHGTMRNSDLIETFRDELEALWPSKQKQLAREHSDVEDCLANETPDDDLIDDNPVNYEVEMQEYASEYIQALADALGECAPQFFYFGANEGDGSDYGFWLNECQFRDAMHDGDMIQVENVPDYIVVVNDHGNMTLFSVATTELWGAV